VTKDRPSGTKQGAAPSYADVGVDIAGLETGLDSLVKRLEATTRFPRRGRPVLPNGFFANVLDLGSGQGLALSTDGVGTKVLVAHALGRYDTIGIDLIAMNVNDVLCVGAEPVALVDYVAVPSADAHLLEQLAIGLVEGARQSRISIPGGEIAQVRELLRPHPPDGREGFDLVATAVGVVALDRIIVGQRVAPGDVVIGLPSAGIHSNGLTLARRVLAPDGMPEAYAEAPPELGGTSVGEELLRPTRIYVREAMSLLDARLDVRAMAHITGDGLLNLLRIQAKDIGFVIDAPLEPCGVFTLLARRAGIDPAEMYTTFNMGIGFCVVVPESDADRALALLREADGEARPIGRATRDPERRMVLPGLGLVGRGKSFAAERR
jgi:phosphoribosylformylglycinamidine cyclo-ligase